MRTRLIALERLAIGLPQLGTACAIFCCCSAVCIFVLPFATPVQFQPVISASYVAGFNNRAAAIAAALMSVAACLWIWRRQRLVQPTGIPPQSDAAKLSFKLVTAVVALTVIFTALAGWALHVSRQRYLADAGYFIEQMSKHTEHGGSLYSQVEFAYGPLLFYPTIWLRELIQCSTCTAYFVTLAVEQSIGLLELAFVINALPLKQNVRRFAFVLFAIGAINPLLGLNYTLFRYLTPVALLLMISKVNKTSALFLSLAAGEGISLGISAEMGVAFAAGSAALSIWKARQHGLQWMLGIAGSVLGFSLFSVTAGRAYFHMLNAFAKGALNLPVMPYPHLLVFLFSVVWLVPFIIGKSLAASDAQTLTVLVCYGFALALLPSALGRCDPIHVFFNGLIFSLVSLAALTNTGKLRSYIWSGCLLFSVLWQIAVTNRLFRFRTADTLSAVLPARAASELARMAGVETELGQHVAPDDEQTYQLDISRLERWVGSATVATPEEITPDDEAALRRSGHFQSSYFAYMVNTFAAPAEQRAIGELNDATWTLVPADYGRPFIEAPGNLQDIQGFVFPLKQRHQIPFLAGDAMARNLQQHWKIVDQLGPYLLLRHD